MSATFSPAVFFPKGMERGVRRVLLHAGGAPKQRHVSYVCAGGALTLALRSELPRFPLRMTGTLRGMSRPSIADLQASDGSLRDDTFGNGPTTNPGAGKGGKRHPADARHISPLHSRTCKPPSDRFAGVS